MAPDLSRPVQSNHSSPSISRRNKQRQPLGGLSINTVRIATMATKAATAQKGSDCSGRNDANGDGGTAQSSGPHKRVNTYNHEHQEDDACTGKGKDNSMDMAADTAIGTDHSQPCNVDEPFKSGSPASISSSSSASSPSSSSSMSTSESSASSTSTEPSSPVLSSAGMPSSMSSAAQLNVSIKRHGQHVRNQHSKRRRRRRRRCHQHSGAADSNISINSTTWDFIQQPELEDPSEHCQHQDTNVRVLVRQGSHAPVHPPTGAKAETTATSSGHGNESDDSLSLHSLDAESGDVPHDCSTPTAAAGHSAFSSLSPSCNFATPTGPSPNRRSHETPQQQVRRYWELCYGSAQQTDESVAAAPAGTTTPSLQSQSQSQFPQIKSTWSAQRKPPIRSCLSHSKARAGKSLMSISETKRKAHRVQFGSPQAVEYEIDDPAKKLTPLPEEVARKRYSMDVKEQTEEEVEQNKETKHNTSLLAEWEDDFDQPKIRVSSRRRKNRRDSQLFTPSPRRSLSGDKLGDDDPVGQANDDLPPTTTQDEDMHSPAPHALAPSAVVNEESAPLQLSPHRDNFAGSPVDTAGLIKTQLETTPTEKQVSGRYSISTLSDISSEPSQLSPMTLDTASVMQSVNSSGAAMDATPSPPSQSVVSHAGKSARSVLSHPISTVSSCSSITTKSSSSLKQPQQQQHVSPSQSSPLLPTQQQQRTASASSRMSLGSIHTMGGAIESPHALPSTVRLIKKKDQPVDHHRHHPAPHHDGHHSPIKHDMSAVWLPSDEVPTPKETCIVKALVHSPACDREWGAAQVLSAMASNESMQTMTYLLEILPAHIRSTFLKDIETNVLRCTGSHSHDAASVQGTNQQNGQKRTWECIESRCLKRVEGLLDSMDKELDSDVEQIESLELRSLPRSTRILEHRFQSCQDDIAMMEAQIRDARWQLDVAKAMQGPSAALDCEALSHLMTFRLLEVSDDRMSLNFEHAIGGIGTMLSYEMVDRELMYTISMKADGDGPAIARQSPGDALYSNYLQSCLGHLPQTEVLPDEMQSIVVGLAKTFQSMTVAAMDLNQLVASKRASVSVDFPSIRIEWSDGMVVAARYDVKTWQIGGRLIPGNLRIIRTATSQHRHMRLPEAWAEMSPFTWQRFRELALPSNKHENEHNDGA